MADARNHILKQNVMKEEFGWEVPVESVPLPSKGMIYSPDSTLYNRATVPIRAMTAHEEDILSSQALIKEGTVINDLISSCVTDKTFDIDNLTLGDRNALMVSVRITGYGPEYNVSTVCEKCGHNNKVVANLSELEIKRLSIEPVESGKNEFEFTLPVTKKTVTFKFLTSKDERDKNTALRNAQAALKTKIEKNITSYLKYTIVSVDGVRDKNKIHHFVMNMPAWDSKSLRDYIQEHEPGMDMTSSYNCSNCGQHNKYSLPMTSQFFWPSK